MIHLNIVTEEGDWILPRWACSLYNEFMMPNKRKNIICTISTVFARPEADVNLYFNYGFFSKKTKGLDICYFTHRENAVPKLAQNFDRIAQECDYCVAQSSPTLEFLPVGKSCIIEPAVDHIFVKSSILIGIVGRNYEYTIRKRFNWVQDLENLQIPRIEFVFTNGQVPLNDMPIFYKMIDYLLITSAIEGGPMPLIEALNMGKPVIAPAEVGWCDKFSVLRYTDFNSLVEILKGLTHNRTWGHVAQDYEDLINKLLSNEI